MCNEALACHLIKASHLAYSITKDGAGFEMTETAAILEQRKSLEPAQA